MECEDMSQSQVHYLMDVHLDVAEVEVHTEPSQNDREDSFVSDDTILYGVDELVLYGGDDELETSSSFSSFVLEDVQDVFPHELSMLPEEDTIDFGGYTDMDYYIDDDQSTVSGGRPLSDTGSDCDKLSSWLQHNAQQSAQEKVWEYLQKTDFHQKSSDISHGYYILTLGL